MKRCEDARQESWKRDLTDEDKKCLVKLATIFEEIPQIYDRAEKTLSLVRFVPKE